MSIIRDLYFCNFHFYFYYFILLCSFIRLSVSQYSHHVTLRLPSDTRSTHPTVSMLPALMKRIRCFPGLWAWLSVVACVSNPYIAPFVHLPRSGLDSRHIYFQPVSLSTVITTVLRLKSALQTLSLSREPGQDVFLRQRVDASTIILHADCRP
jgi:hypothetical protein